MSEGTTTTPTKCNASHGWTDFFLSFVGGTKHGQKKTRGKVQNEAHQRKVAKKNQTTTKKNLARFSMLIFQQSRVFEMTSTYISNGNRQPLPHPFFIGDSYNYRKVEVTRSAQGKQKRHHPFPVVYDYFLNPSTK